MGKIYKVYSLISVKASRPHQAHPLMQQRSVAESASLPRCDSQEKQWEEYIIINSFFSFIIYQWKIITGFAGAATTMARLIFIKRTLQHLFSEFAQSTTEHLFSRIYWSERFNMINR